MDVYVVLLIYNAEPEIYVFSGPYKQPALALSAWSDNLYIDSVKEMKKLSFRLLTSN